MVAHYSGNPEADTSCPNCGQVEKAEHLCVCPCEDRTRLINEKMQKNWDHSCSGKDHRRDPLSQGSYLTKKTGRIK